MRERDQQIAHTVAAQLAAIVTSSTDAIISVGLDRVVRTWNRGATLLFGYTESEAVGHSLVELIVPDDQRDELASVLDALRKGRRPTLRESMRRCKDGRLVVVDVNASPMFDSENQVLAISVIFRDLSERRQADSAIHSSEAKLKLGMSVAGVGLATIAYVADTVTLDETAAAMFGLPANTPIARADVHARFHPEDAPDIAAKIAEVLDPSGSGFMAIDHRIVWADGSIRWVSARKQVKFAGPPTGGAKHASSGLLAVLDISERKCAEYALAESETRYRSALEAGRMGSWQTDLLAKTRTWSEAGMTLFGLTLDGGRGQVGGENDEFLASLHPEDRHMQQRFHEQADQLDSFEAEYRIVRPDGTILWLSGHGRVTARQPDGKAHHLVSIVADVTARKAAEKGLRISEIRYRRLFEAAHDGVLLLDPGTRKIIDANPFMTKLLGYSHDEFVGKELFEIGLLKDEVASRDMFEKLKITHQIRYEDLPLKSLQGRQQQVEVVANLYDEGGHAVIQCNIREITARKQVEALVQQNAALFSTLVEQAPSGMYVIDSRFRVLQINARALPVFATIQNVIGRDFDEVVRILWGRETGKLIADIFRHTLATGARYVSPLFHKMRHDIGVEQAYEWEAQRVFLADGQYGVACYFNDVTERKRADDELIEREAHVRRILDNTLAFVGLMSIDGTLLEANASALTAAGIAREEVVGRKFWDAKLWSHDMAEMARLKAAVARSAAGELIRYDVVVRMAGDTRMEVDFMLAPVRDATGAVVLLVPSGVDITERKRAEQHNRLLMAEVNHRSMNLLAVVQAVARQTARDGDPATFVGRLSDRIDGLAASQDLLIKNEWQGVELSDLIEAQLALFKDLIGTRVLIDGPRARLTPAAAQGVGMALHELATNAAKYGALSNSDGRVRVSWHINGLREPSFAMHWLEEGGPKVASPTRKGFGQMVIGRMAEAAVDGTVEIVYGKNGFSWKLSSLAADTLERRRIDGRA
jgi:PAS domain S-box-containing protein